MALGSLKPVRQVSKTTGEDRLVRYKPSSLILLQAIDGGGRLRLSGCPRRVIKPEGFPPGVKKEGFPAGASKPDQAGAAFEDAPQAVGQQFVGAGGPGIELFHLAAARRDPPDLRIAGDPQEPIPAFEHAHRAGVAAPFRRFDIEKSDGICSRVCPARRCLHRSGHRWQWTRDPEKAGVCSGVSKADGFVALQYKGNRSLFGGPAWFPNTGFRVFPIGFL